MSSCNTNQHRENRRKPLDVHSEGAIELVQNLLQSGYAVRVRVSGRSMLPFLKGGEIVTLKKVSTSKLRRGDIVLYVNEKGFPILHRIIRLRKKTEGMVVQTKGDGLPGLDVPVDQSKVIGFVISIEVEKNIKEGLSISKHVELSNFYQRLVARTIALVGFIQYVFHGGMKRFRRG